MNFEHARHLMIEQQLRPWRINDDAVIDTLYTDRREEYAPAAMRTLACADVALPLGGGAVMLPPKLEAHALQALAPQEGDKVLEIGAGSGHMAALLARRAAQVWSFEIDAALAGQARDNLRRCNVNNVEVIDGDGLNGLADEAPFDIIMVSGSLHEIPAALTQQLAAGGRLLAFVVAGPWTTMRRISRDAAGLRSEDLLETEAPPLQQPPPASFEF